MTMDRANTAALIGAAIGAMFVGTATAQVHPEKPTYKYEKCYGIAKAGMNDCSFAANSCAGTVDRDNHPAAWLYVPKGSCLRIAGGTLEPPKSS